MKDFAWSMFFRVTAALAVICFVCLFFIQRGTAEFFILIFTGIVNCVCVLISLIVMLTRGKKK